MDAVQRGHQNEHAVRPAGQAWLLEKEGALLTGSGASPLGVTAAVFPDRANAQRFVERDRAVTPDAHPSASFGRWLIRLHLCRKEPDRVSAGCMSSAVWHQNLTVTQTSLDSPS